MIPIITAEEFDGRLDDGEDVSEFLDWDRAKRPGLVPRRVNGDVPAWMIGFLDLEARRISVIHLSIMKVWLSERLKAEQAASAKNC